MTNTIAETYDIDKKFTKLQAILEEFSMLARNKGQYVGHEEQKDHFFKTLTLTLKPGKEDITQDNNQISLASVVFNMMLILKKEKVLTEANFLVLLTHSQPLALYDFFARGKHLQSNTAVAELLSPGVKLMTPCGRSTKNIGATSSAKHSTSDAFSPLINPLLGEVPANTNRQLFQPKWEIQ